MEQIKDYHIIEQLEETKSSIIYRARKKNEVGTVIIKALKAINPYPSEVARFKQEYEIIKAISLDGVVKTYEILDNDNGFALVLEDFNGVSIRHLLKKQRFDLSSFLKIAIQLTETLGRLHQMEIIHKDINPGNILLAPDHGTVKLTDFGISSILTHENEDIYDPDLIFGTLPYISPEQTGRMNRSVDYRTDLYSLGVTFYEMLVGTVPFHFHDPLELFHCHIAIKPSPPADINPEIPNVISEIILKLLSKIPEDRYQNGFGIMADLQKCHDEFHAKGRITPFRLGQNDFSHKFNMPQLLYGRDDHIRTLMSIFENVSEGRTEIVTITGQPGIGKSALVHEIHKPIVAQRGYFLSGKYEQLRRNIPYNAIIQALQGLIQQIISEPEESIRRWKEKLQSALTPNGKLITHIIPNLELIIGKQPDVVELGPEESKNRFEIVFEKLVTSLTTKAHPIVLFLDDLQWADHSSHRLIQLLATSPIISHLLIICTYRDNEISHTHLLSDTFVKIEKKGKTIHNIAVTPLTSAHINELVIHFLKCTEEKGFSLSKIIFQKTGGNPFFVNQFLKLLYTEKLIAFDPGEGWQWEEKKITSLQVTDNLVALLADTLTKLPQTTLFILKICACIGNRFDLETISTIMETTVEKILEDISEAIRQGVIHEVKNRYEFHHDRIQEAVYSLISEKEKTLYHHYIGCLTLDKATREEEVQAKLFYITDQLNLGKGLFHNKSETEKLIRLNLQAGLKAKLSAAFAPALKYFSMGIDLLDKKCWDRQYDLALALYQAAAETAYLDGDLEKAERLAEIAISNAKTTLDKVKTFETRIHASFAQQNFTQAIGHGLTILKLLGLKLPENPSKLKILVELIKIKALLATKTEESILNQPLMTDKRHLAIVSILRSLEVVTSMSNNDLFALIAFKLVNLTLKDGLHPGSALGFVMYGGILIGALGDIKGAIKYGDLSLRLNALEVCEIDKSKVLGFYDLFMRHWTDSIKNCGMSYLNTYKIAQSSGNLMASVMSLMAADVHSISVTKHMKDLMEELEQHHKLIEKCHQEAFTQMHAMSMQFASNYEKSRQHPGDLTGDYFDADHVETIWKEKKNYLSLFSMYYQKAILSYEFDQFEPARQNIELAGQFITHIKAFGYYPIYTYYDTLIRLALYPDSPPKHRATFKKQIGINIKRIEKWAQLSPDTHLPWLYLIKAEKARVCNDPLNAEAYFDLAEKKFKSAHLHIYALMSNQRAGQYYQSVGKPKHAKLYMSDAHHGFNKFGLSARAKKIEDRYPDLLLPLHLDGPVGGSSNSTFTGSTVTSESLDLSSIMKASRAISGEIVMTRLLHTLMSIIMENAGAEKGFLILENHGKLLVEAEAKCDDHNAAVNKSIPIETHPGLSSAIVTYVARTNETVLLNNAEREGAFTHDPHVIKNRIKSILCLPILNKGKLSAILYLENNVSTHAFTENHITTIQLLTSQASVSIENARLYESVFQSEEKYRTILKSMEEGYLEFDLKGTFLFANDAISRMLGYSKNEIIGKSAFSFIKSEKAKQAYQTYNQVFRTGESIQAFEHQMIKKDGSLVDMEVSISLIVNQDGKKTGFRGVLRDITQRKQTEKLKVEKEVAEAATRAKSEFLANMSHEIRTPMNAILGFTGLLKDHVHGAQPKQFLDTILASGKTLMTLINDILDLSKIEAGKLDLNYEAFNPAIVLGEMQQIFSQKALENNLELIVESGKTLPEYIYLDETRLRQILINLVGNAVKFTENGHVKISMQGQKASGRLDLVFKIEDTGIGIPADQTNLIFESFQQQKGQAASRYGGTGLGLSITKRLVGMMGGEIFVESEVGKGSTFFVRFKDVKIASDICRKTSSLINPNAISFPDTTVLVIDDIENNRLLIKSYLDAPNFTILEAGNGEKGIDSALVNKPDVIFMDIKMPVMDGYEATKYLRNTPEVSAIPIIAITASIMKGDEIRIKEAGCDGLLRKPMTKEQLVSELIRFLPYTEKSMEASEKEKKPSQKNIPLSPEAKKRIPQLIDTLENEVMEEWKVIQDGIKFTKIKHFALNVTDLGDTYSLDVLKKWGQELHHLAENFDVKNVPVTIRQFPDIINQISSMK